ncbi:MAG: phage portal protein [Tissierellia bacterium]|nr:phage portal protein [Tissierellia bacterium]
MEIKSLNLGATIPEKLSKTATVEIEIETSDEQLTGLIDKVQANLQSWLEYGLALGEIILKSYISNGELEIQYVLPDNYVILEVDSRDNIRRIVFIDTHTTGKKYLRRLEEHRWSRDNTYVISNRVFKGDSHNLGKEVSLKNTPWQELEAETTIQFIDRPLFGFYRNPMANNLDPYSVRGISCFANALSLIQDADEQYSRYLWEFEAKETAIDVDITMLDEHMDLPQTRSRLYRGLNANSNDFYKVYSPDIREEALNKGLNSILRRIEDVCGLDRGSLSDELIIDKTATEVKASKQRLFVTVQQIQKAMGVAIRDLFHSLHLWRMLLTQKHLEEPELSISWGDSVLDDSETTRNIKLQEYNSGIISAETYLMEVYGVSEDIARDMMGETAPEDDLEEWGSV